LLNYMRTILSGTGEVMLKNLKLLRDETGVSQLKLAESIGMSQQSVNGYENSEVEPDISTLIKIADYFETSVDFVIGHTDIRRKIEPVSEFALNDQEARLMRTYRKLRTTAKTKIGDLMEEMLSE